MSQIYKTINGGGPIPPQVPTTFTTDDGVATPVANNINFFTDQTLEDFDTGITNTGVGDTVTHYLTNRATRTVITTDANPTEIFRESFGATPSVGLVWGVVLAYNVDTNTAATFGYSGGFRVVNGLSVVELGVEYDNEFCDVLMEDADIEVTVDGNDLVIEVIGINPETIHWSLLLEYRKI